YRQMADSSYAPLTRVATKIEKDEVGHAYLGYTTVKKACQTAEGKAEAQRLLNKWYPIALDMFGSPRSKRQEAYIKWGLKKYRNEELRQMYLQEVIPLLTGLGLAVPDTTSNRSFV
ncbi:MAG: Phenylacetic acid catabolic protein, partial [Candidatus Binatia bacterium]